MSDIQLGPLQSNSIPNVHMPYSLECSMAKADLHSLIEGFKNDQIRNLRGGRGKGLFAKYEVRPVCVCACVCGVCGATALSMMWH